MESTVGLAATSTDRTLLTKRRWGWDLPLATLLAAKYGGDGIRTTPENLLATLAEPRSDSNPTVSFSARELLVVRKTLGVFRHHETASLVVSYSCEDGGDGI